MSRENHLGFMSCEKIMKEVYKNWHLLYQDIVWSVNF